MPVCWLAWSSSTKVVDRRVEKDVAVKLIWTGGLERLNYGQSLVGGGSLVTLKSLNSVVV